MEGSRNGEVSYSIDNEASEYFSIGEQSGTIKLIKTLDYEGKRNWKVSGGIRFNTALLLLLLLLLLYKLVRVAQSRACT